MPSAEKKEEKEKSGSKISNTEWGMAISILGGIDAFQFFLDTLGIPFLGVNVGTFANRFIDIFVGMAWPTYLYLRGVNLKSVKLSGSILLTFLLEEIPDVDALPLWVLDGLFVWSVVKAEEKIKEETGADVEKIGAAGGEGGEMTAGEDGAGRGGEGGKENTGGTGETGSGEEGPGISDEAADSLGQESDAHGQESESDNPYEDETEDGKSARMEGEEGDGEHDISDEDADELGKESDARSEGGDEKKDKKKPGESPEQEESGDGRSQRGGGQNPNRLDLRSGRGGEGGADSTESTPFRSNLLDLSLSYGARKKKRGNEGDSTPSA